MRLFYGLFLLAAVACCVFAQTDSPVAGPHRRPERPLRRTVRIRPATIPRDAPPPSATIATTISSTSTRSQPSLGAIKPTDAFLSRLQAIATAGFSDQDQLSHDLLIRVLQQRIDDFDLKEYEMPVNQQNGIHTDLADLPLSVPLDSVKHYEDYIARLHQIPRVLSQTTEVLRAGMKDNLMPVRFLIEKLPVQCQGIIDADPFLLPTKKYPAEYFAGRPEASDAADHRRRQFRSDSGLQGFRRISSRTEYAPHGRTTLAVTSLPDGEKRYQNDIYARTTTHMTAGRDSPARPTRDGPHPRRK